MGPFQLRVVITRPSVIATHGHTLLTSMGLVPQGTQQGTDRRIQARYELPSKGYEDALLFHLARLLEDLGGSIRQCSRPSCRRLFLQLRHSAIYCDRRCQSVDTMRRKREEAKAEKVHAEKRTPNKRTRIRKETH